jgi:uncharacterized membrane protein
MDTYEILIFITTTLLAVICLINRAFISNSIENIEKIIDETK